VTMRKFMLVLAVAALVLPGLCARPAAAQDSQQSQANQAPPYTMPEYNAYQAAANEKDAKQRVKLRDDFVAKFPNSSLLN
jgi:outer membrane biogenesis lipoprotein LolB